MNNYSYDLRYQLYCNINLQSIKGKGEKMKTVSNKRCPDIECEEVHVHENIVEKVAMHMPDEDMLYSLAEFFKVFADSTRIKILYALLNSEMCVCDISEVLEISQSAISHQLRLLKQMKLVKFRREGKSIFYSLSDEHIISILSKGMEHVEE